MDYIKKSSNVLSIDSNGVGRGWEKQAMLISLTCKMLLLFFK